MLLEKVPQSEAIPGIQGILNDDETGWESFVEHYLPLLIRWVKQLGGERSPYNDTTAEDVAQEILAKVAGMNRLFFRRLKKPTKQGLESYFFQWAKNLVTSRHRRVERERAEMGSPIPDEVELEGGEHRQSLLEKHVHSNFEGSSHRGSPEDSFLVSERRHILLQAVADLPSKGKETVEFMLDGWKPGEIADELGVVRNTVYQRLDRAKPAIRAYIQGKYPEYYEDLVIEYSSR